MSAQTVDNPQQDADDDADGFWQARSACAEANWSAYTDVPHDPETFFPKRMEGGQCAPAKSLCQQCPVRTQCLTAGMRESTGVWGGLSEKERRTAQKMVKIGYTVVQILAHFDAQQPQRRRKTNLRAVENDEIAAAALTGRVIEQFMTTIGTLPVGVAADPTLAATAAPVLPPVLPTSAPSREVLREAERRRNGL